VNAKEHTVAFSMYPTTVDQLMAISDVGQIMPPKEHLVRAEAAQRLVHPHAGRLREESGPHSPLCGRGRLLVDFTQRSFAQGRLLENSES
jgi:hypothetical protein